MSARFRQLEPARRQKGTAGRVAVWGGSSLYCGAPYFACQAAVQLGVDLVFLKPGHPSVTQAVKARSFDIMCDADHHAGGEGVTDNNTNSILERCDALVVGPGLGRAKATVDALQEFFAGASSRAQGEGGGAPRWPRQKPLVIDADGLFALCQNGRGDILTRLVTSRTSDGDHDLQETVTVLTPNGAEMNHVRQAVCNADEIMRLNLRNYNSGWGRKDEFGVWDRNSMPATQPFLRVVEKGEVDQVLEWGPPNPTDHTLGETSRGHAQVLKGSAATHFENAGSGKRCGGLGDILSGLIGALLAWRHLKVNQCNANVAQNSSKKQGSSCSSSVVSAAANHSQGSGVLVPTPVLQEVPPASEALVLACYINREAARRAFLKKKRAMVAEDVLAEIPAVCEDLAPTVIENEATPEQQY
eukprot:g4329.t1